MKKAPLIDAYYAQGVGIASAEGPGDDNEMDWEHVSNLRTELMNYNYEEVYELYDGTHSGTDNDESGNPSDDDLANLVNAGTGIINYTGHGSTESISTTGFNNSDAEELTNTTKWPFLWIVGCVTGNFNGPTCFAEVWARSTHEGSASGGLASMMSTINQYWDQPMEGQDEMNLILTESYEDNIKRTFGGISINGCFSMNDEYGTSGEDMTDTWVCFGDPSVFVRTSTPQDMVVSHDPTMVIGISEFMVSCDADNSVAALTSNGSILATAVVTGGMANLSFDPLLIADTLTLTITGYNKVPYIADIPAIATVGPNVIGTTFIINDLIGNNNGQADYNEAVTVDATLENIGFSMASDVNAKIATTDPYITIIDESQSYGDIEENSIMMESNAFSFSIAGNVPDGHEALFVCTVADNSGATWNSTFSVTINAPVLAAAEFDIDVAIDGNGDGYLDPAETATIIINNWNEGHSTALNSEGMLFSSSTLVTISDPTYSVGNIDTGSPSPAMFEIYLAPNATYGSELPFTYTVTAGSYSEVFNFIVVVSPAIETFETNDFSLFQWEMSGDANWFTTSENPYEGTYCAQSGDISENQSSTLSITLDVQFDDDLSFAKKISSEAGYDFFEFYIDGEMKNQWSGEADWSLSTYPIAEGTHTFKWSYTKEGFFSTGSDCAWLDDILLPTFETNAATTISSDVNANSQVATYPNPFDRMTVISYHLNAGATVSVKIFNEIGQEMKELINSEYQTPGSYQLAFDGSKLPSGTYFCNVIVGEETHIQKLILSR
jgi:hypothetical protein